jgi:hypothetical protein
VPGLVLRHGCQNVNGKGVRIVYGHEFNAAVHHVAINATLRLSRSSFGQ